MLILDLWGIGFHAVVVFGLGKDFLFKSILGRCVEELGRYWNLSRVDSLIKISLWIIISLWWSSWENVSKPGLMSLFATSLGHNVSKTSLNSYLKLFALKISRHLFIIYVSKQQKMKIMCYFIKSLAPLSNFRISSGIPILDLTKPNLTSFGNRTCFF